MPSSSQPDEQLGEAQPTESGAFQRQEPVLFSWQPLAGSIQIEHTNILRSAALDPPALEGLRSASTRRDGRAPSIVNRFGAPQGLESRTTFGMVKGINQTRRNEITQNRRSNSRQGKLSLATSQHVSRHRNCNPNTVFPLAFSEASIIQLKNWASRVLVDGYSSLWSNSTLSATKTN